MTVTMFDFGSGEVPAHKHVNGGGWVADTAYVEETAYVGSEVGDYVGWGGGESVGDEGGAVDGWGADICRVYRARNVAGLFRKHESGVSGHPRLHPGYLDATFCQ